MALSERPRAGLHADVLTVQFPALGAEVTTMIDRDLLQSFVATFYGYGTWNAPFWFVGMEEAGVETLADFERRLQAWIDERKPSLVDLKRFHERIGFGASLSESAPLQPTWRPLTFSPVPTQTTSGLDGSIVISPIE